MFILFLTHLFSVSLWLFVDADLGCSENAVANLPACLHDVADGVLVLIGDPLLYHELCIMNVWVKFLVNWVELDDIKTR